MKLQARFLGVGGLSAALLWAGFPSTNSHAIASVARHTSQRHASKHAAAVCKKRNTATGTIKYSSWQFPDTLNPLQTSLLVTNETTQAMFDNLYLYNNKAKMIPEMATAIPTVANGGIKNGGKTYVIHLKKGLHFSTGQEITSRDIKFSLAMFQDKLTGPYCSGSCDIITRVDTPDKYTAVFHLKSVYAAALPYAINGFGIYPRNYSAWNGDPHLGAQKMEDPNFNFENSSYPTSGAYQVAEFVNNDRIALHPMKYYSDMNCGAYAKNLIFVFYSSKEGMIAAAASKNTDVTQDYTVADLPELRKHKTYTLHVDPGFAYEHIELMIDPQYNGKPNPLANTNVRLALALAMDKLGLIRSALGVNEATAKSIAAWTPLINTPQLVQPFADKSMTGQWDPIAKKYQTNTGTGQALADAKKLLARTPFANGFTIDFYTTMGNPVRQAQEAVLASNWARLKVQINPNYLSVAKEFGDWDHGGLFTHGQFQMAMFGFFGSPDPDQDKYNVMTRYIDRRQSVHAAINGNYSGIADPVIDQAFNRASRSLDPRVRAKYYKQFQVEMNKRAYWLGLYYRPSIATDDGNVLNFFNNPTQYTPEWNVFNWRGKG